MKKLLLSLIILLPGAVFGSSKISSSDFKGDQVLLSKFISSFDVSAQSAEAPKTLKIELMNMNGVKKTELLNTKMEEYKEYTRYSFNNPFNLESKKNEKYNLELYMFDKIKPTMQETKEVVDNDISEISVDLMVLIDPVTKKTLKAQAKIFFKDFLVAEGNIDSNTRIKITDNLSDKTKNYKIQELRVIKNLLGSDKRSIDLQIKYSKANKQFKENLNINLLNMKQTPIVDKVLNEDLNEDQDIEGNENETTNRS